MFLPPKRHFGGNCRLKPQMVVVGTGLAGVSSGSSGAEPSRRCKLSSKKVGRLNLRFYGKVNYVGDLAKWFYKLYR